MGGGSFLAGSGSVPVDEFVLGLARNPEPKVCFIPTAGGDSDVHLVQFYEAFQHRRCTPSHLALFTRTVVDIKGFILDKDVIYVGGGNTANMLAVWRLHGVDVALRDAWHQGVVLCGASAGGLCWFEGGTTDSFGLELAPLQDGLGFLEGSFCPHYDGEVQRRPAYHRFVEDGVIGPGYAADNFVGMHFVGTALAEVVTGVDGATAYRVELIDGHAKETRLPARMMPVA
jgi:dipeptidase E